MFDFMMRSLSFYIYLKKVMIFFKIKYVFILNIMYIIGVFRQLLAK